MKNKINKLLILIGLGLVFNLTWSCQKDFLDVAPTGQLTEEVLSSKQGLEGLLIGTYAMLANKVGFYGGSTNWVHGSVLGGEANKGSNNGDQAVVQPVQRFETLPTNGLVAEKWSAMFEGVSRANTLLRLLGATADPTVSADDKTRISAEARFLRGHYYFELKRSFNNVPYVDESMLPEVAVKVPNTADIWPKIEADFDYAWRSLPETQSAIGRSNKWAAGAYLAKVYLYQGKYAEAKTLFDQVIADGKTTGGLKYTLMAKYADIFNTEFDNNAESVFAVQAAAGTGSVTNANAEYVLNFPYNGGDVPGGCCGFFSPSFELANSFRVDANGLPLLDGSYNDPANALKNDQGLLSPDPFTPDAGPVDPRLDHSVGRRGLPYLDWGNHPGNDWIRDQSYGGPYTTKKYVYYKSQKGNGIDASGWTPGYTTLNYTIIRFADVLLMAAEAEAELGNLEKAREYVNQVRARAANPASWVKQADGSDAANYVIGLYNSPFADVNAARTAIRFERKLELSSEGQRFFDLVRWGIADATLDAYLAHDGAILTTQLGGATFTANKNEYYPIPQVQIDRQGADVLKQNPGY